MIKKIDLKAELLFMALCVLNIYIIPFAFVYRVFLNTYMLEKFIVVSGKWICGTGGAFTMLAAAVYGALKKEKDEKWIWTDILLGLPAAVIDVIMLIKADMPQNEFITREYEFVMMFVRIILLLFQTAAGMWLGRLITGKYKGERQLYPLDIIYTAAACVCCYILCAASKTSWIIINVSRDSCYDRNRYGMVIILFFAVSVLYGIFSKAEELHERVVRAMTVGFLAFLAFDWV